MPVSNNSNLKPIVFIHMQKVAGHSIRKSLESVGYSWKGGINKHERPINISWDSDRCFSFAFVRNPFDLCVSRFFYHHREEKKLKAEINKRDLLFHRFPENKEGFNSWIKSLSEDDIWKQTNVFGELWPWAYKPQKEFLSNHKGKILVDFIGRYENLYDDFDGVCKKIKCENHLNSFYVNKSLREADYRQYYNDSSIEMVSQIYKTDLEYFNYSF
jgi:hypothetical protein